MLPTMSHNKTSSLLLLIALGLCCLSLAHAAKISTKTTSNPVAVSTNSTNIEQLVHTTKTKPTVITTTTTTAATTKAPVASSTEKAAPVNSSEEEDDDDEEEDEADLTALTTTDAEAETDDDDDEEKDDKEETAVVPAEKNPVQSSTSSSSFSIWGMVRNVWNWIRDDLSESLLGDETSGGKPTAAVEGRTFGKIRRLQQALIPLMFKFGILSAMITFLVMLGMKTLFLVKLLVLMNAAGLLAKLITLKSGFNHIEHSAPPASWSYNSWNPHSNSGWGAITAPASPQSHGPSKEIHLHIHGGQVQPQVSSSYSTYGSDSHGQHGWASRSDPYAVYEPAPVSETDIENELNNMGPINMLPTKYPTNLRHR